MGNRVWAAEEGCGYERGQLIGTFFGDQFILEIESGETAELVQARFAVIRDRFRISYHAEGHSPFCMSNLRLTLYHLSLPGSRVAVAVKAALPNPRTGKYDQMLPDALEMGQRWIHVILSQIDQEVKEQGFLDLRFDFQLMVKLEKDSKRRLLGFKVYLGERMWICRVLLAPSGLGWWLVECGILSRDTTTQQVTFSAWERNRCGKGKAFSCFEQRTFPEGACWTEAYFKGFMLGEQCAFSKG